MLCKKLKFNSVDQCYLPNYKNDLGLSLTYKDLSPCSDLMTQNL